MEWTMENEKKEYVPLTHEELVQAIYERLIKKPDEEIEKILSKFENEEWASNISQTLGKRKC